MLNTNLNLASNVTKQKSWHIIEFTNTTLYNSSSPLNDGFTSTNQCTLKTLSYILVNIIINFLGPDNVPLARILNKI